MRKDSGAVMVALHDGFFGCGTGAGHSNRRLLELLDDVLAPHVELIVLPVRLEPDSAHFDAGWHRQVRACLGRSGRTVRIVPVDNGTAGRERFGGLDAFADLAEATAQEIAAVRPQFRRGLVLLLDVPFLGVAAALEPWPGWDTLVLPRSSAALHCPEHTRRAEWEGEGLRRAAARGAHIGAISLAMRRHLVHDLGVDEAAVVDLVNGLTARDQAFTPGRGGQLLPPAVATGAGFWFSMGRAVPRKGLMDLLEALVLLRERGQEPGHLVLAAVSEREELTAHQRELAAYIRRHALPVTLLTRFCAEVRQLLAHPGLRMVVVPSRVEPFGRIPLEAYAAGAAPVVATTAGGLAELVEDSVTGFTAAPGDVAGLADALARAAAVDDGTRMRMRSAGLEVLRRYDYRRNLTRALRGIAPWTLPAVPAVAVPVPRARRAGLSVLQVPEECGWNPYVAACEQALTRKGLKVLRPGLCLDNPAPGGTAALPDLDAVRPDVVHVHWPEKLAGQYGPETALRILARFKQTGARIVQTVHNIAPHEPTSSLTAFVRRVDASTDGVHFFSAAHEAAARPLRPYLPQAAVHVPHPLLPGSPGPAPRRPNPLSMGCFGRLRDYKRTLPFARAFLDGAPPSARLLVAGAPDSEETHDAFTRLAARDERLEYRPGFRDDFWELLTEVEWVALPYERLHSSGVLVAALQAHRRILSPTPIGGRGLYAQGTHRWWWTTLDPWEDRHAVATWRKAAVFRQAIPPSTLALPTWTQAAADLAAFYARLTRPAVPVAAAPARVGIL